MKILIYSETRSHSIKNNLGAPEYSYYFVLQAFLPALRQIGDVSVVSDPEIEVDEIYLQCKKAGESCLFLSFSPPHRTLTTLRCPTIPVFAWEFDDIPYESWGGEPLTSWRRVLELLPAAITHSMQARESVVRAMGGDYPVAVIPAPIWSRVQQAESPVVEGRGAIDFDGVLFDSAQADWDVIAPYIYWHQRWDGVWLSPEIAPKHSRENECEGESQLRANRRPFGPVQIMRKHWRAFYDEVLADLVPRYFVCGGREAGVSMGGRAADTPQSTDKETVFPLQKIPPALVSSFVSGAQKLELSGVVYTAVLNPEDGRKNIRDMVSAFCLAFRENSGVTLLIKLTHASPDKSLARIVASIYRSTPFQCRVVLLAGYLDDEGYQRLIKQTSYVVNTSHGEGQCLPLMEFMSLGKPAIAPGSSAMADYITEENAFVIASSRELTSWPHDPRQCYRTYRYRLDYSSLLAAYRASYDACLDVARYQSMSEAARTTLQKHCSDEIVVAGLRDFLKGFADRWRVAGDSCDGNLDKGYLRAES